MTKPLDPYLKCLQSTFPRAFVSFGCSTVPGPYKEVVRCHLGSNLVEVADGGEVTWYKPDPAWDGEGQSQMRPWVSRVCRTPENMRMWLQVPVFEVRRLNWSTLNTALNPNNFMPRPRDLLQPVQDLFRTGVDEWDVEYNPPTPFKPQQNPMDEGYGYQHYQAQILQTNPTVEPPQVGFRWAHCVEGDRWRYGYILPKHLFGKDQFLINVAPASVERRHLSVIKDLTSKVFYRGVFDMILQQIKG